MARKEFNLKGYILGSLRKLFRWWPEKRIALNRQKRGQDKYECEKCRKLFSKKEVHIDHILPCVDPRNGFVSYDEYIDRLFCHSSNLQILCIKDHKLKTQEENRIRKELRNARSENTTPEGSGTTKKSRGARKKV